MHLVLVTIIILGIFLLDLWFLTFGDFFNVYDCCVYDAEKVKNCRGYQLDYPIVFLKTMNCFVVHRFGILLGKRDSKVWE